MVGHPSRPGEALASSPLNGPHLQSEFASEGAPLHLIPGNKSTFAQLNNLQELKKARFEKREQVKQRLVASLERGEKLGLIPRGKAFDVDTCHQFCRAYLAPGCKSCTEQRRVSLVAYSCSFPLCPHCQYKRSARLQPVVGFLFEEMQRGASERGETVKFITFTVPNVDSLAKGDVFRRIRRAFNKLRRRRAFKQRCKGGLYVIESTHKGRGWNVHIHVLAECAHWPQIDLAREWKSCLDVEWQREVERSQPETHKDRAIVYIRPADDGSVMELSKYLVKGSNVVDSVSLVAEYYRAARNRRLFESFGDCRGSLRQLQKIKREETVAEEFKCPHGFSLDFAGNLRGRSAIEVIQGFTIVDERCFLFFKNRWEARQPGRLSALRRC